VAAAHDDVVKRWNLVANAEDHSADDSEREEETDGGEKEPEARAVGYMLVQNRAQARAMKKREQERDHHHENYEEKCGIVQLQVHGTLDPGAEADGNSRGPVSRRRDRRLRHKMSPTRKSRTRAWHLQTIKPWSTARICAGVLPLLSVLVATFLLPAMAAVAEAVPPELVNGLKWRLIGPFRGGRAVAVAGVPGDSTTFYFGAVNGGIWKTTDAGMVWRPIFDGQPVGSIGALAVAPSDPKTIYAGTGESDIRSSLSFGNGVYKSPDNGATWKHLGLDDTRHISRIVIDPQNADIVYVGALGHAYGPSEERGVYKSVDGGAHWARVLDLGPDIGVSDLAICASAPQILFAGAWHTHRPPWSTYAPIDGPGSGLYRSQDAGKTWTRLEGNGLPDGDWGRLGVDVSPDGKRVYALIFIQAETQNQRKTGITPERKTGVAKSGLYRSDDGGNTWVLANSDARLTSRAWYFNGVTIDPRNPDVIYVPNVALYRSEDGGKTISVVRGAPGGDDYHQIWIDPKNSASMVLGTDQGTTISLDRGATWSSWYNQPTAQLYHVTTDNQYPYVVYGAQQDSDAVAVLSRTNHRQITPRDWFPAGPSESGYIIVDPKDPDILYLSGTYGTVARFNRRTELSQDISPWPAEAWDAEVHERKYRGSWTTALALSPADATALYLGTQYVMKTTDGGLHWETISPDLTGAIGNASDTPKADDKKPATPPTPPTLEEAKRGGYGVVFTIAPSPINRDLIWAGSDTGLIHLSRDGGKNWKDVTPRGLSAWSKIALIEASHYDPAVAFAAVDRSRLDDFTPYIYRTRDYGATWHLITDGIGTSAFLRAVREDPQSQGLLFAGTEFGVYVSFDDGDHWQSLQLNLPVSSVRDLTIHGDDLVIGTHGRSFWILDNITPLRQVLKAREADGARLAHLYLYRPGTAIRVDSDSFTGTPLPPEEPTAENPPNGAMIDYFLPSAVGRVTLEVYDAQQNLVRRFSSDDSSGDRKTEKPAPLPVAERWLSKPELLEKSVGMHRFVWDLIWGSSGGSSADEESESRNPRGPKVVPGTYEVRLTVDGTTQSQPLKVVMDPRSPATAEVLAQQFQLGRQIFGEAVEAHRVLAEIGSVQEQLADLRQKVEQNPGPQSGKLKSAMEETQSAIARILRGKDKEHSAGESSGLQEAYTGLASALRVVEGGDRTAPAQAIEVSRESGAQIKARIAEWAQLKQARLEQLNRELRAANFAPIESGR